MLRPRWAKARRSPAILMLGYASRSVSSSLRESSLFKSSAGREGRGPSWSVEHTPHHQREPKIENHQMSMVCKRVAMGIPPLCSLSKVAGHADACERPWKTQCPAERGA